ncbi:MAG: hypothetical protein JO089_09270 [Alphaproteobacteria bacterium]|nr:hypothetical protein [Alphaproteobacteria bacterium]
MRYEDLPPKPRKDDFSTRRRLPTMVQFALLVSSTFLLVLFAHIFTISDMGFGLTAFVVLCISNGIVIWSVQTSRDTLLATEFQNALLGAALSIQNQFCLIVRKDGTVVFADRGYHAMYPQFDRTRRHHLEEVLTVAGIGNDETGKICDAAYNATSAQVPITVRDGNGMTHSILLLIDPIRRPQDYVFLRARLLGES